MLIVPLPSKYINLFGINIIKFYFRIIIFNKKCPSKTLNISAKIKKYVLCHFQFKPYSNAIPQSQKTEEEPLWRNTKHHLKPHHPTKTPSISHSSKLKQKSSYMVWRKDYLDAILVPSGLLIMFFYHVFLLYRCLKRPEATVIGYENHCKKAWVSSIMQVGTTWVSILWSFSCFRVWVIGLDFVFSIFINLFRLFHHLLCEKWMFRLHTKSWCQ